MVPLDFHQEAEEQYDRFDINEAVDKMTIEEDREFLKSILNLI